MTRDIEDIKDIQKLVDTFYSKVKEDALVGHFFNEVVDINWDEHMPRMYTFWSSILFDTHDFDGNPMDKHLKLNNLSLLKTEHFERWLELWGATVEDLFQGPIADKALTRAKSIATMIQIKIFQLS